MDFDEVLVQVREQLESEKRIAYRILRRRFKLDNEDIEDVKADLIKAKRVAIDEDGEVLVWAGDSHGSASPHDSPSQIQPPASYTPQHLAERIRAEQSAMESRGASDGERKTITMWQSQPIKP